jgi:hypothetical protein
VLQKIGVRGEALPEERRRGAVAGNGCNDARKVSGLGGVLGKFGHVAANRLELPPEALGSFGITLVGEHLVYQPGDDVGAQRQSRHPVVLLLPQETSPLEEWLMTENIRRRP